MRGVLAQQLLRIRPRKRRPFPLCDKMHVAKYADRFRTVEVNGGRVVNLFTTTPLLNAVRKSHTRTDRDRNPSPAMKNRITDERTTRKKCRAHGDCTSPLWRPHRIAPVSLGECRITDATHVDAPRFPSFRDLDLA